MVNKQRQDVVDAKIIAPIHKKGLITMGKLMEDLDMHDSFQKIAQRYREISIDNILRILIRWKMYFAARTEIIKMINEIDQRENWLDNIRNLVLSMKDDYEMDKRRQEVQELSNYLQKITKQIEKSIFNFMNNFKQFGKWFVFDSMVSFCS